MTKIQLKGQRKKIENQIKDHSKSQIKTTMEEMRMDEKKTYKKLIENVIQDPDGLDRIIQQMEKIKHHLEYEIGIITEKDNQIREVVQIIDRNKTIPQVIQEYTQEGIKEGETIYSTKLTNAQQKLGFQITQNYLEKAEYVIKRMDIKIRFIKGGE